MASGVPGASTSPRIDREYGAPGRTRTCAHGSAGIWCADARIGLRDLGVPPAGLEPAHTAQPGFGVPMLASAFVILACPRQDSNLRTRLSRGLVCRCSH